MSIAGGFISGYFFYTFSVLRDKAKKQPPILQLIYQQISNARDALSEMSYEISGLHDLKQCPFGTYKEGLNAYEISPKNKKIILRAMRNIELLIQYPMLKVEVLDKDDIERISKSARNVFKIMTLILDTPDEQPIYLEEKNINCIKDIHRNLDLSCENLKEFGEE